MSSKDFPQIDLNQELLLRIGSENDDHVIAWDVLKNIGDKLEALIRTIAKHSITNESNLNLDNYKLEFSGFYNGSAVPAFKLNSHPTLSLFPENNTREAVIVEFSKIMNRVDKGNYQAIADEYNEPTVKNEVVKKLYDFTNSAGTKSVTIVKRDQEKFTKVYAVRRLKKETYEKLVVSELEKNQIDPEISTAVAKVTITKDEAGKTKTKPSEIYDDKEAILSLKLDKILFLSKAYFFKFPVLFQIYSEGRGIIIENEQLDLYASGKIMSDAKIDLYSQFDNSYKRLNELKDEQLNIKLLGVKSYFNSIVKLVKDI